MPRQRREGSGYRSVADYFPAAGGDPAHSVIGVFAVKVEDPTRFMKECFGTSPIYRVNDIVEQKPLLGDSKQYENYDTKEDSGKFELEKEVKMKEG